VLLSACLSPALDLSVDKKDDGVGLVGTSRDSSKDMRDLLEGSGVDSDDFPLLWLLTECIEGVRKCEDEGSRVKSSEMSSVGSQISGVVLVALVED
jgi:hypothetical protein